MFTERNAVAPMDRRASRHLVHLEQEHNRLARRALTSAMSADGLAATIAAQRTLRDSDAALVAALAAYNACVGDTTSEAAFARRPLAAA